MGARRRSAPGAIWIGFCFASLLVPCGARAAEVFQPGRVIISEFMAANSSVWPDSDGDYSDWIELVNLSQQPIGLAGWSLSDDAAEPGKWEFPAIEIGPGDFLLVYASGKNRRDPSAELHANFSLSAAGDYLGLFMPDRTPSHEFAPAYPEQVPDVSYGVEFDRQTWVDAGASALAYVPQDDSLGSAWREANFAASAAWTTGTMGAGFGIADVEVAGRLLVNLDAMELRAPKLIYWKNAGTLGDFVAHDAPLAVETIEGVRAVTFGGADQWLRSNSNAPQTMTGNEDWSIEVWAFNPVIDLAETLAQWTKLIGPRRSAAALNYGSAAGYGAIQHWGSSDRGYAGGAPAAGSWHHIALTYTGGEGGWEGLYVDGVLNTSQTVTLTLHPSEEEGYPIVLGAAFDSLLFQNSTSHFTGSLAAVRIHSGALTLEQVRNNYLAEAQHYGASASAPDSAFSRLIGLDLGAQMRGVAAGAYLRIPFRVEEPGRIDILRLAMQYDDGFVAWINGTEVARCGAPLGDPAWNWQAASARTGKLATREETLSLTANLSALRKGENLLAIQGLNVGVDDGDFRILPRLSAEHHIIGSSAYLSAPSPGGLSPENAVFVEAVEFSHPRGLCEESFQLTLSCPTPDAEIRYTTDGTEPTAESGILYEGPIPISGSSMIRAVALQGASRHAPTQTQTFIFPGDVLTQKRPAGYPTDAESGYALDYNMDSRVVEDPLYAAEMKPALRALPSLSIVMSVPDLFGKTSGIYANATQSGDLWERGASVEFMEPQGGPEFQINCAIRMQGAGGRNPGESAKHNFRLIFKNPYGPTKLHFKIFEDSPVEKFEELILRTPTHDSWHVHQDPWRNNGKYATPRWIRQTQLAMGHPAPHGRYVHLYLNGLYWGIYDVVERPNAAFAAAYKGGEAADYDAVNAGLLRDGEINAWDKMNQIASGQGQYHGIFNPEAYEELKQYLDVVNMTDYLLLHLYAANIDWPAKNYYAARRREEGAGYMFFSWDCEAAIWDIWESYGPGVYYNHLKSDRFPGGHGAGFLYSYLKANADYRMLLSDRLHKHISPGGVFSPEVGAKRYREITDKLELPLVLESARWGDAWRPDKPYTREEEWRKNLAWVFDVFFPLRSAAIVGHFREAGVYPDVDAPVVYIDGFRSQGGRVAPGAPLQITDEPDPIRTIVPEQSVWRCLNGAEEQGTTWREPDFDDSAWPSGPAELGTNAGDPTPLEMGTDETPYTTVYFRHSFEVEDTRAVDSLDLHLKRDDGAVVYLNGNELVRDNMPEGEITFGTSASRAIGGEGQDAYEPFQYIEPQDLRNGENVLAVEVHQSGTSKDLSFDLRLDAHLLTPGQLTETVYYTVDGSDPRAPGGASPSTSSLIYTLPMQLDARMHILARAFDGEEWSALTDLTFFIYAQGAADNLAITEINYNPHDPTDAEKAAGFSDKDDFEFLELHNRSTETIDLAGVEVRGAVEFDFAQAEDANLDPGEFAVLVENPDAFRMRYGPGPRVVGLYGGKLANNGETIDLRRAQGETFLEIAYNDSKPWPVRADGRGSTLELCDPSPNLNSPSNWRASVEYGGSPGRAGLEATRDVVVNEVLTRPSPPLVDTIELYNTTAEEIDLSGWYLGDSPADDSVPDYFQFRIPDGTTLEGGAFRTFTSDDTGFGLSGSSGDGVWLMGALDSGGYRFADHVEFGPAARDESFGRCPDGSGPLCPMSAQTLGGPNAAPRIGPIVLSELHYNPGQDADDLEFIEVYNPTRADVEMGGWRLRGDVEFDFTSETRLSAGGVLVVVGFDPYDSVAATHFRSTFHLSDSIALIGPYAGRLSDTGGRVRLERPEDPGAEELLMLLEDEVAYGDAPPWPVEAAGGGASLTRLPALGAGSDPASWTGATPTPGSIEAQRPDGALWMLY